MTYKKKTKAANPASPKNQRKNSGSGAQSEADDIQQEVIETEVELHPLDEANDEDATPFSDRVREHLSNLTNLSGDKPNSDNPAPQKKKYYNSYAKKKEKENRSELGELITAVLVILVTALPAPEELKPVEEEVGSLSSRVASIMFRHGILTGKVSGDVLDVIGILAVSASYWQRVRPVYLQLKNERSTYQQPDSLNEEVAYETPQPVAKIDPFLDRLAQEAAGG